MTAVPDICVGIYSQLLILLADIQKLLLLTWRKSSTKATIILLLFLMSLKSLFALNRRTFFWFCLTLYSQSLKRINRQHSYSITLIYSRLPNLLLPGLRLGDGDFFCSISERELFIRRCRNFFQRGKYSSQVTKKFFEPQLYFRRVIKDKSLMEW